MEPAVTGDDWRTTELNHVLSRQPGARAASALHSDGRVQIGIEAPSRTSTLEGAGRREGGTQEATLAKTFDGFYRRREDLGGLKLQAMCSPSIRTAPERECVTYRDRQDGPENASVKYRNGASPVFRAFDRESSVNGIVLSLMRPLKYRDTLVAR